MPNLQTFLKETMSHPKYSTLLWDRSELRIPCYAASSGTGQSLKQVQEEHWGFPSFFPVLGTANSGPGKLSTTALLPRAIPRSFFKKFETRAP